MDTDLTLGLLVDQLATLNAEIKRLTDEADGVKQILINAEQPIIESTRYRASISLVEPPPSTNWKAIAEKLGASRQMISANSKPRAAHYRVSLSDL